MTDATSGSADHQATIALKHAQAQRWLAITLFAFSFAILGWVANKALSCEICDQDDRIQLVFTTITTLVGTWVGTLIAFYFSRENFEAASRSMQKTIDRLSPEERLHAVPAENAMIPRSQMTTFDLATDQELASVPLAALVERFASDKNVSRLPILKPDGSITAIVHRSLLNRYLQANKDVQDPTIGSIENDTDLGPKLKLFGVIAKGRTLRDAKTAMGSQPGCKDVFVTATGAAGENVIGWITDSRIIAVLES